ncbi:MAG: DUF885 domain-containing protein [Pseudomonadota bacterium]
MHRRFHTALVAALFITACAKDAPSVPTPDPDASMDESPVDPGTIEQASLAANALFDELFMEQVKRNPIFADYLGVGGSQDKWPDLSEAFADDDLALAKRQLARLKTNVDPAVLDEATRLSFRLMVRNLEQRIAMDRWRDHNYPVNQMGGLQSGLPTHLRNVHRVRSVADANNYIARLNAMGPLLDQLIDNLKRRENKGIVAPKFVYPYVIDDSRRIISGAPFDGEGDSTLWADITTKINALDIDDDQKQDLMSRAKRALTQVVGPAYQDLIVHLEGLSKRATADDGAWKFPDGEAFYAAALRRTTTTDMDAEDIHALGLAEVARIHDEMRRIMDDVGFEGSLGDFFDFMRTDPQFYFDDTPEGRAAYLADATALIDAMRERLDDMFIVKPKAALEVRAVEPYREASAGKAFYNRPAPDGSRPGIYYANLYRMADMPTYQMEALAYHEAIPGHHMQLAIAQELEGIPMFRKWNRVTAYTEGWGLYSEKLPKEFGFYEDPYSDFGRLAMELWRACRLVVDTGIHHKRWTREQAIDYLSKNSPNPKGDVVKAIERYIVLPSQATAYKIGMNKMLDLRERAREALGDRFDLRRFHDVVLKNGPVPLAVLESLVDDYIQGELAKG